MTDKISERIAKLFPVDANVVVNGELVRGEMTEAMKKVIEYKESLMRQAKAADDLGAIIDRMGAGYEAQCANGCVPEGFLLGMGKDYMEDTLSAMRAAQEELLEALGA